jgi:hypothetical protein
MVACQKRTLADNKIMNAKENWDDVLPSREVEQEKLGQVPEVDCDKY